MGTFIFFGWLMWLSALSDAAGSKFNLEFENAAERENQNFRAMWREHASKKKTLLLYEGDYVVLDFCLSSLTSVTITNVRFSNDGKADNITLILDGREIGSFETFSLSNWGNLWNVFHDSGHIGQNIMLHPGNHELNISVTVSDNYGVEFDSLQFTLDNEISEETFLCQTELKEHVMFRGIHTPPVLSIDREKPKLIQQSFPSSCIDESNVNICFNISTWIGAHIYVSSEYLNNTGLGDSWENAVFNAQTCNEYEGNIWKVGIEDNSNAEFGNAEAGLLKFSIPKVLENLAVIPGDITNPSTSFEITFKTDQNILDTYPWTIFTLGLVDPDQVSVSIQFIRPETNTWSPKDTKILNGDNRKDNWYIPTDSFSGTNDNKLKISFESSMSTVSLDFIRLDTEERSRNESSLHIFENKFLKIRGVKNVLSEFKGMKVSSVNEEGTLHVDKFSIMARKGRRAAFAKILTIHCDGRIFLHTLAEHRHFMDLFPKVVSEASGMSLRPDHKSDTSKKIFIQDVLLDPADLVLNVTYTDGSKIMFRFSLLGDETKLVIYDIQLAPDVSKETFGCYFSKAHSNAMAAVDKMTVDRGHTYNVLDNSISGVRGFHFKFDHEFAPWYVGVGSDLVFQF